MQSNQRDAHAGLEIASWNAGISEPSESTSNPYESPQSEIVRAEFADAEYSPMLDYGFQLIVMGSALAVFLIVSWLMSLPG